MGRLRRPEVLREPDRRPAHVLGAGDRRGRQRRPDAGRPTAGPSTPPRRRRRSTPARRRRRTSTSATFTFASEAGATFECSLDGGAYADLHLARRVHRPRRRRPHASRCARPTPPATPTRARRPTPGPSTCRPTRRSTPARRPDREHDRDLQLLLERARLDVRVRARRASRSAPAPRPSSTRGLARRRARAPGPRQGQPPATSTRRRPATPGRSPRRRETTIDSRARRAQTESTAATFTFSSDQAGVDLPAARSTARRSTPCTSPVTYTGLAPGAHDFEVQAIGPAGNVDPTPAELRLGDRRPDAARRDASATRPGGDDREHDARRFTFSVDDPEAATAVLARRRAADGLHVAEDVRPSLAAGAHTFEVTAVKQHLLVDVDAGRRTPGRSRTTTAPDDDDRLRPRSPRSRSTPPRRSPSSSNEADATFECSLDPGLEPPVWSACAAPPENVAEFDLAAGEHTVLVRAVDPAANADATPATYTLHGRSARPSRRSAPARPTARRPASATATLRVRRRPGRRDLRLLARRRRRSPPARRPPTYERPRRSASTPSRSRRPTASASSRTRRRPATWTIEPPPDTTAPETTIDSGPAATTGSTTARRSPSPAPTPARPPPS